MWNEYKILKDQLIHVDLLLFKVFCHLRRCYNGVNSYYDNRPATYIPPAFYSLLWITRRVLCGEVVYNYNFLTGIQIIIPWYTCTPGIHLIHTWKLCYKAVLYVLHLHKKIKINRFKMLQFGKFAAHSSYKYLGNINH